MIKWSAQVLPHRHRQRGFARGLILGACVGFICGLVSAPQAAITCDHEAIIFNHYAETAEKIHGFYYRPDLMPPERKPR